MILVKTEAGQRVLKDRSIALTPRQRSAFILCDGKRSVVDVLEAGMGVSRDEIDQMVAQGLLALVGEGGAPAAAEPAASPAPAPAPAPAPVAVAVAVAAAPAAGRSDQQRYKDAYPIATQLTGSLGLRGFRLNLSVEGTANCEQLLALLPKIEAAVGPEKAAALARALRDA
jgi:pyruvate/2-oxoglutarate dehydrogenase complex dihydrolipoamide acyltransferase (E2) component